MLYTVLMKLISYAAIKLQSDGINLLPAVIRRGGSYNKDGRRKDSKKGSKRKLPCHKTSGKTKN
jgi:hypothetical protein